LSSHDEGQTTGRKHQIGWAHRTKLKEVELRPISVFPAQSELEFAQRHGFDVLTHDSHPAHQSHRNSTTAVAPHTILTLNNAQSETHREACGADKLRSMDADNGRSLFETPSLLTWAAHLPVIAGVGASFSGASASVFWLLMSSAVATAPDDSIPCICKKFEVHRIIFD